jgi:hypothetical protein
LVDTDRATSLSEDERELSLRGLDFSSMLVLGGVGSIVGVKGANAGNVIGNVGAGWSEDSGR